MKIITVLKSSLYFFGDKIFLCIVYMIMNVGDKFIKIRKFKKNKKLKIPFLIFNNQ